MADDTKTETETQEVVVTYQVKYRTKVTIPKNGTVDDRREAMLEALENINVPEQEASNLDEFGHEYVEGSFKPIHFTDENERTVLRELKLLDRY